MKKFILTLAATFALLTGVHANTSYLLIQGPFGLDGAIETFKWRLDYASAEPLTGKDLLFAILGNPTPLTESYSISGDALEGAGYRNTSYGLMLDAIKLSGSSVAANPGSFQDWNYYVAGGLGEYAVELQAPVYEGWTLITPGVYDPNYPNNGEWVRSNDGFSTRTLLDGSFDAWVYGTADWLNNIYSQVDGSANTPTTINFADATAVTAVPEPSSIALVGLGLGGLVLRRYRSKK